MPDVIINFKAQISGEDEVQAALVNQGKLEKAVVDQVNAANKAFAEQLKAIGGTAKETDKLAASLKNLPKSLVGGGIRDMTGLAKSVKDGTLQVNALATAIELSKKKLAELAPASEAYKKLRAEINASLIVNEKANKSFNSTSQEVKAMKNALLELEDAGLDNTKVYQELSIEAAKLTSQIGDSQARIKSLASSTFGFDAAIGAVTGLTAAFSVGQGVIGLFGTESEEIQKTLLKVNAAMAILTGLQQIQNTIQRQTAVTLAVENALRRIGALSTALQSAAESKFIVVRYAAIAAQRVLNTVMGLNPAAALLIAIGALSTALLIFTRNSEDAADAQEKLNSSIQNAIELSDLYAAAIASAGEIIQSQLRSNNATEAELRKANIENIQRQLEEQFKATEKAKQNYALANENYSNAIAKGKELSDKERSARLTAYDLANNALQKFYETQHKLDLARIEDEKATADESLQNATAFANARVSRARKGSIDELNATIDAIRTRTDEQLKSEGLLAGKREEIIAQSEREIQEATLDIQRISLQKRIDSAEAAAIRERDLFKKLSAETAVVMLNAQKQSIGTTAQEAIRIEAERNQAIIDLRTKFFGDLQKVESLDSGYLKRLSIERFEGAKADAAKFLDFQAQQLEILRVKRQAQFVGETDQLKILANEREDLISKARIDKIGKTAQEIELIEANLQYNLKINEKAALDERAAQFSRFTQFIGTAASSLAGSLTEISKNQSEEELAILQKKYDDGIISQEQFEQEQRNIRRRAAVQEKALALFQASIAQSLAILAVLKDQTIPIPLKPVFIALTVAQAVAQLAAIASRPIPAFAKGTKSAPGGKSLIGEAGGELYHQNGKWGYAASAQIVDLRKGAKVIPAKQSDQILRDYNIPIPGLPQHLNTAQAAPEMDYTKLARAMGKEIAQIPVQQHFYDEYGITIRQTKMAQRANYQKTRYSSGRV